MDNMSKINYESFSSQIGGEFNLTESIRSLFFYNNEGE